MGKAWYYTPSPLPSPPPGWARGKHPRLFVFDGVRGTYEIRQAHRTCFVVWRVHAAGIERLPFAETVEGCFAVVTDAEASPA